MEANDRSTSARTWLVLAAFAALFALHVWRFRWLCDDAFISLRYARNLTRGLGLVYNPGEDPCVEGYTNFLWVLCLAPFEALTLRAPAAAVWGGALCGVALVLVLGRWLVMRLGSTLHAALALAFAIALPPLACWSTSGLETMPFTLALFACFAALHAQKPRAAVAAACAAATVLLRADGALSAVLVIALSLAVARAKRDRTLARAAFVAGGAALLALLLHLVWRRSYYGVWEPNTARVKVELSAMVLERGFNYAATFLISFPAVVVALCASFVALRRPREPLALACAAMVAACFAYSIALGGDFMAMGRFLVPCLPFLAVLFGLALARLPRAAAVSLPVACVALSLPTLFGRELLPASLRQRFEFRYSSEDMPSEFEQWHKMRQQAARWAALGRALARHSQPGESLMIGTIGAIGYYSELVIYDPFGLVSREELAPLSAEEKRSPGHQRRIPYATFLAKRPTYLEAALVPRSARNAMLREVFKPGGELYDVSEFEWLDASGVPDVPPDYLLRRIRYVPRPR